MHIPLLSLLVLVVMINSQVLSPDCGAANGVADQEIFFESWNDLEIKLLNPGHIEVIRSNATLPSISVRTYSIDTETAETVVIGIDNNEDSFVVYVGDDLPPPPIPPPLDEDPEGSDEDPDTSDGVMNKYAWWMTTTASVIAATGTQYLYYGHGERAPNFAVPVAAALLPLFLQGADAQNATNTTKCLYVVVTLTLPEDLADQVPAEVGKIYNTSVGGIISYKYGYTLPAGAGYGNCVNHGISGECISTSQCKGSRQPDPGLCPGPSNIQCCSDYWGSCSANGKNGVCRDAAKCSGTKTPGLCPGPNNIQCCTSSSSPPASSGYSAAKAGNSGVTFAKMTGRYWPLQQGGTRATICYKDTTGRTRQVPASPTASNYGCDTRRFLGSRSGGRRYHSGVDLYAPAGTVVRATEAGRIVNAYKFFENVCCVIQQTDSGIVVNYGEISCNYVVRRGQRVSAGQKIGVVGNLNCCHPMLHFETYTQGTTSNIASYPGKISSRLRNPTEYLLNLRERGL